MEPQLSGAVGKGAELVLKHWGGEQQGTSWRHAGHFSSEKRRELKLERGYR